MNQGLARRRAHELGGIAVGARWKGDRWLLGGWPNAKDETWIVVSLDKTMVLDDGCGRESCGQDTEQKSGYTTHGRWFGPGEPTLPAPDMRARCGGPAVCLVCRAEAGDPLNKHIAAANRLEELATQLKGLVIELREGTPDAYKKVYELRRELSRVVATLGEGQP
jgi:hypothetical protein